MHKNNYFSRNKTGKSKKSCNFANLKKTWRYSIIPFPRKERK